VHDPLRRPWTEPGRDPQHVYDAQRGDLAALFTLLREYRRELWSVCFALTLDRTRAERLFHETLLRASKNLRSVPNGAAFLPWLVRLALNGAAAIQRRDPAEKDLAPSDRTALGTELTAEQSRSLHAFAELSGQDRLLYALAAIERLPYGEIGTLTRRDNNAVIHEVALLRVRLAHGEAA
jgi:DNA-directed RNA polymerase specialized sigma24 family protein